MQLRLVIGLIVIRLLPELGGGRARSAILRLAGTRVGRSTVVGGPISIAGSLGADGLRIGQRCILNSRCHFDVAASIDLDDGAGLGHEVLVLTGTHQIGGHDQRYGRLTPLPVHIGRGVWIGARATILPGVTIGDGAIVAAGALVARDVEPDTMVGGIPARFMRSLEP